MHDTTGSGANPFTRRIFLQHGLAFASLAATTPAFLERSARAMTPAFGLSSQPGVPDDHVLVVVQLGGGNDGLNTVVPYGDDAYYRLRPGLAVPAPGRGGNDGAVLPIDDGAGIGLHPSMAPFKSLIDDGVASIVQGVGYPNPNRSHFTSMDVWHTARTDATGNGWIGRYFDHTCAGAPDPEHSVSIGRSAPLAMIGDKSTPVSFETAELFRWLGKDIDGGLETPYDAINRAGALPGVADDGQLGFLMRTALDAQISSDRIRKAVARRPLASYPASRLADQLRTVAAMIRDGLRTRVYYVSLGGFDTHANQRGPHANLLGQVSAALAAFHRDLSEQGNSGRVLTMVFSEFGRRVAQNASGGTDHGTAAPMYLVGDMVRPGLLGQQPSLTDLDEGDLKFNVDFRSVYATVLEDWMGVKDARSVLRADFRKAKILADARGARRPAGRDGQAGRGGRQPR